ncbi:MAG: multifunctional CCA tRNA nucleotidyl transferase/2'3'-cyclic phosphodiesterase/2'nucleotidase/phosphatase [Burkholderiaceae bacterium]
MKIYRVGGAVRDALLGLPPGDTDWVVVGATPERMAELGFTPVGRDFPVFLHPRTHEEYALARTERKTSRGYRGFAFNCSPEVSLEDDLARRDLTINAIAQADDGSLVDPFGGQRDIEARILRHVGEAFAEDPVRILRLARFAARFPEFDIAPETMALMRAMVASGEVDALVPERSWQEIARGLMTAKPSRMFLVLRECGALARILPELDDLAVDGGYGFERALQAVDHAAAADAPLEVRFAALCSRIAPEPGPAIEAIADRLRVPNACRVLALLVAREQDAILAAIELPADALAGLVTRLDLIRRPERLEPVLAAVRAALAADRDCGSARQAATRAAAAPVATADDIDFPQAGWLRQASAAARSVDAGAIAAGAGDPGEIPALIQRARVAAIAGIEAQRPAH